jgi:hypothetical protein
MRGRKPRIAAIAPADLPVLQQVSRSDLSPWFQVRRARLLLGLAGGQPVSELAFQMACDESTVWRTARLYEQAGLAGLLTEPARLGRPTRLSPPAARRDRRSGLS